MNRLAYNLDYVMPREGEMAQRQLAEIVEDATALRAALHPDDNLPAWTQYKISTAQDRLHAASGYLLHKIGNMDARVNLGAIDEYLNEYGNPKEADKEANKDNKKAKIKVPFRDRVKPYAPWAALVVGIGTVLYFGFRPASPASRKSKR